MAAEVETSGVIVKASKSSCVVSVNIDGCTKSFSVSKTIFYVFGVKCDGNLTNLVEEDTEVELSYRVRPGNAPTIVAVWLGDKPDLSEDGERRIPVYDRKGVLNDIIVYTDFGQVYVNRGVVFRDGQRETGVILNEEVVFDAVPVREVHFSGAFYQATCAWIGSKPRLVDRFHLEVGETEDVELEDDVCGIVAVIPNNVVAFVDVEVDSVVVKVMLFRSSFSRVCDRIQDSVDVGDKICMRLRYAFVFPGRKHWFAVSARKASEVLLDEICDSEVVETLDAQSDDIESDYYVEGKGVLKTDGIVRTDCGVKTDGVETGRVETDGGVEADGGVETHGGVKTEEVDKFVEVVNLASLTTGGFGSNAFYTKTGKVACESVKDSVDIGSVDTKETASKGSNAEVADQFDTGSSFLYSDPPLEGVLHPNGCITCGRLKILLDPSNFYVCGEPCLVDDIAYLANGRTVVSFEAVLMRRKEKKFSEFSHEATCAWIEKKPALAAIAASLPPPNFELLEEPKRNFYGKVIKICFPRVALMVLPDESVVSIHVNGFVTKPQYPTKDLGVNLISSYVRLDDWVQFKVKRNPAVPKFLTAHEAGPVFVPEVWAKISPRIALHGPSKPDTLRSDSLLSKPSTSKVKAPDASPGPTVCIASPFKTGCVAQHRAYLINCVGTIKCSHDALNQKDVFTVDHVFGSSSITDKTVYISNGKNLSLDSIATQIGRQVHFDAQAPLSPNSNTAFVITRMWDGGVRPASEVVLFTDIKLFEGVTTRWCPAKIISIPLHDTAIASVKGVPILVPFDSLVTLQEVNMACSAIDTLLNVGDFVGLKFEKRKFPGEMSGSYFRAVSCWSLRKGGEKATLDEIRIAEPHINSWFSLWGCGQFFCKGKLKKIGGRYYVDYTSRSSGKKMNLDIFEKGKVCAGGELVELEKFEAPDDGKITFHVGHSYVKKLSDDLSRKMFEPEELFAACSWIRNEPVPEHLLRDILAVTKGLICSNRFYEVVVQSFPTPTHAICRLGFLPVLVPLPQLTQEGNFVGIEDVNLRKGDRILVNVLERVVTNKTVLVSNTPKYKRMKDLVYQDVLKNVSGIIKTLPNPTGLIKAFNSDLVVSFELCNVRRNTRGQNVNVAWIDSLSKKFTEGTKVYFSAVKADTKTAPYRAFEVFYSEFDFYYEDERD